jgi:bifunctional UDP-N-acetylglucosamine pyrophosphorylase / glucosamine-1-phosphate N-acetyltransferase
MTNTNLNNNLTVVILAAGKGKRMMSDLPKPLIEICGKPMLAYLIETVTKLSPKQIIIVYSYLLDPFQKSLAAYDHSNITWVEQPEQLGTGHAALCAIPYITASQTMFLCADTPLVKATTLQSLIAAATNTMGIITTITEKPTGFGRIVRNKANKFERVVEEKDVTNAEKNINEVATGIMLAPTKFLAANLSKIKNDNTQQEYYLPEIMPMWLKSGNEVSIVQTKSYKTTLGANNLQELALLEKYQQQQIITKLMLSGVKIINPDTINIQGLVTIEPGATIEAGVTFKGKVIIKAGATIGYHTVLQNATIGENATILPSSVVTGAAIAKNATIGPFAHIRPNTYIAENAKIGSFVEIKSATIGKNSKANHLAYIGNAEVGENVNIGAGTVTCNYDGANKFITIIEDNAFVGSGTYLIAPITIGKNSYIGAGSCLTKNTPPNKLTFSRTKQVTVSGWAHPRAQEEKEEVKA